MPKTKFTDSNSHFSDLYHVPNLCETLRWYFMVVIIAMINSIFCIWIVLYSFKGAVKFIILFILRVTIEDRHHFYFQAKESVTNLPKVGWFHKDYLGHCWQNQNLGLSTPRPSLRSGALKQPGLCLAPALHSNILVTWVFFSLMFQHLGNLLSCANFLIA